MRWLIIDAERENIQTGVKGRAGGRQEIFATLRLSCGAKAAVAVAYSAHDLMLSPSFKLSPMLVQLLRFDLSLESIDTDLKSVLSSSISMI